MTMPRPQLPARNDGILGARTFGWYGLGVLLAALAGAFAALNVALLAVLAGVAVLLVSAVRVGLRRALLGLVILSLTLVGFGDLPGGGAWAEALRYGAVSCLLIVTWHHNRAFGEQTALPMEARRLLLGLWGMAGLGLASTAWSISSWETVAQAGAFALLVLLIHLSATGHWRTPDGIAGDMTVIFWVLAAAIATGFFALPSQLARAAGLYNNPNNLAIACVLAAAIGCGLYAHKRSFIYLPTVAMAIVALLLTQSRTAIVAGLAAVALVALRRGTSAIVSVIGGTFMTFALLWLALPAFAGSLPTPLRGLADRFMNLGSDDPLSNRVEIWTYAYQLWERRPIAGYGFRTGEVAFEQSRGLGGSVEKSVAHNSYVQTLLELGLVGLIPSAILLLATVQILRRCDVRGLGIGMVACAVIGLGIGAGESAIFGVGQAASWTIWLTIGAAACLSTDGRLTGDTPPRSWRTGLPVHARYRPR